MVKMLTAYTEEIDEPQAAVEEILAQLDLSANALAHSVGLLTCYTEFLDTGVVAALCAALPFDVVGTTTMASGVPGHFGQLSLTLAVLTSDEVSFSAFCTDSLEEDLDGAIKQGYPPAREALGADPALIIAYVPLLFSMSGDLVFEKLNAVSGGLPLFGTRAVDHNVDYAEARVIYNGEGHRERMAAVLIAGPMEPKFFMASVDLGKVLRQKAVITASKDNLLIAVNNMPALDYMEGLGLIKKGNLEGIKGVPFLIDYGDGTQPVVRDAFGLTPDGHVVFAGSMPTGATLGIGSLDYEDVIATARQVVGDAAASGGDALLVFSCVGRNFTLSFDTLAELAAAEEAAGGALPYQMTYSGGEFCPMDREDGVRVNRFHNNTIIACVF